MKLHKISKKVLTGFMAGLSAFAIVGCDSDTITYDGPDYVMFSDTLQSIAIQDPNTYHDIPVVSSSMCYYVLTFAVEFFQGAQSSFW